MAGILRGDLVWADLEPVRGRGQAGKRPVLVVSQDLFNQRSGTVIAMALTSQEPAAGFPLTHEINSLRLAKRSWVKISQIRVLAVERLTQKIGQVEAGELEHIMDGLDEIIR